MKVGVMKHRIGSKICALFPSFLSQRTGSVIVAFAIMAPVIIGAGGAAMDFAEAYLVRQRLTNSLDAAALAAASSSSDPDEIEQRVEDFFNANYPEDKVGFTYDLKVDSDAEGITVSAKADYETSFLRALGIDTITVSRSTSVHRVIGSNIELALVLDISNSMNSNDKIEDLKDAAKALVDTVVYDDQSHYYSKVAIVPYAVAVNAGDYAEAARGAVQGTVEITNISRANPAVVTANGHGYSNGQVIYIDGVHGMTNLNGDQFTVTNATTNTFKLSGVNSRNYHSYTSGGTAYKVCTSPGCEFYKFTNTSGQSRTFRISSCVSERAGGYAYDDDGPGTAYVGPVYPASSNTCLNSEILPLSSSKEDLKDAIDDLEATGSTGGQVGIGWGWYMVSPNFGAIFPAASRPAAYGTEDLHKIVVIMTDGELNSPYYNGVISRDATSGSGSSSDHINHNSSNGSPYSQGEDLCDAMKASPNNIEVYTIGFQIDDYPDGEDLMKYCASDAQHFYKSDNGEELKQAFADIAKNISELYISK
jgi:Flp pilus assembly protein TadG